MKTILIAGILGMICFQSCTKENQVSPRINTSLQQEQKETFNSTKNFKMETEVISIIRCGTEVPGTESGKNGDGTPIFYPSTNTCTANR